MMETVGRISEHEVNTIEMVAEQKIGNNWTEQSNTMNRLSKI